MADGRGDTEDTAETVPEPSSWDDAAVLSGREPVLEPGTEVGRFVIKEHIGSGGMGVVYAAHDPELERRVAVKLVRAPLLGTDKDQRAQSRMLREAQAMARITHPNVATVYDVGLFGERVFIAMEFLDGESLREWSSKEGRGWRAIRDAYAAAGRGLVAAHAAGVVHRDFKPQNVLVTRSGRIVVTDFGLATELSPGDVEAPSASEPGADGSLTRTGAVLGTPAYMAPEQYDPEATVDARTDQYSFCVSLYEALFGANPFGTETLEVRYQRMRADELAEPTSTRVPKQILSAVVRGLRSDPEERFESMERLLDALAFDPAARRRKRVVAGGAVVVAATVGVLGYLQLSRSPERASCRIDDTSLAGAWDADAKAAITAGLAGSKVADHAAIRDRVLANVDGYTARWKAMTKASCESTRIKGEQSERVFDLRAQCLRRRLDEVRGLVDMLAAPSASIANRAVEASLSMTPIRACGEIAALTAPVKLPEDPTKRSAVEALQRKLAAAKSLSNAGQYKAALAAATALIGPAKAAGHVPLHAEVLQLVGDMEARTGKKNRAVETLRRAAGLAEASGHDELLAKTRIGLVHVAGYMLASYENGNLWSELAEATIQRLGDRRDLRGYLELSRGALAYRRAKYTEAATRFERSVEHLSAGLGGDHVDVARVLNNLAMVTSKVNRTEDAEKHFARGLAMRERLLGPNHLLVGNTLANLAGHHRRHGAHEKALAAYERAVKIRLKHQPDHPRTAGFIMSLAMVHMDARRYDQSLAQLERALAIYRKSRTARQGDLDYPHVLGTMGNVYREQKKLAQAHRHYTLAIAALEESGDTKHERAGAIYVGMGMTLSEMGKQREAIAYFERTLAPWEAMAPDHLNLGYPLTGIGVAHLRAEQPAKALAPLERALAIRTKRKGRPENRAETELALAKALWSSGRDRKRAVALAEAAAQRFESLGAREGGRAAAARAWLAARTK